MGLFHRATITPSKPELVERWLRATDLADESATIEHIGAFRFDDPLGEVGIETFLANVDGTLVQVPLTYRGSALPGADAALVGTTEHSALGTRWVYDGLGDPLYPVMLAAVTMTGQGEALGMVEDDGRWVVAPAAVRIRGGGWTTERVVVDGFETVEQFDDGVMFRNEGFDLRFYRSPTHPAEEPMELTATWGGRPEGALLASVQPRAT